MQAPTVRERFDASHLYVVITERFCAGRPAELVLKLVLDAGVSLVQLREKDCTDSELSRRADTFRRFTSDAEALLIIDDRVDIALACGADGVHLGQSDVAVPTARAIAPQLLIGASTHSLEEARDAQAAGADYVNVGPIFSTSTKSVATGALGPDILDTISPELSIPWTVMGGIKHENIAEVLERGARHVAVVTAVTAADDVTGAARALESQIRAARTGIATGSGPQHGSPPSR